MCTESLFREKNIHDRLFYFVFSFLKLVWACFYSNDVESQYKDTVWMKCFLKVWQTEIKFSW